MTICNRKVNERMGTYVAWQEKLIIKKPDFFYTEMLLLELHARSKTEKANSMV